MCCLHTSVTWNVFILCCHFQAYINAYVSAEVYIKSLITIKYTSFSSIHRWRMCWLRLHTLNLCKNVSFSENTYLKEISMLIECTSHSISLPTLRGALPWVIETSAFQQRKARLVCWIDYSKAFDSVFYDALWKVLKEFGVPQHLIRLVKNLYGGATGVVWVQN